MTQSKLIGKTIEEFIQLVYYGQITEVSYQDGIYLESALEQYKSDWINPEKHERDLYETADCNYSQGLSDGSGSYRECERLQKEIKRLKLLLQENKIDYK